MLCCEKVHLFSVQRSLLSVCKTLPSLCRGIVIPGGGPGNRQHLLFASLDAEKLFSFFFFFVTLNERNHDLVNSRCGHHMLVIPKCIMEHWGAACPSGSFDFFFYETQLLLASVLTKGFPVWLLLTGALIGPDFFHLMMDCAPGNFESFNIFLARLSASTSQHSSFLRSNEGFMNFLLCTEPEGHDEDRCENPKCLYSPWSRDRVPPGVVKSIDVPRPVVPNIFLD